MKVRHITSPTTEFEAFNLVESNREIRETHVKSLIKSIQKQNLLEAKPIIVDEKFNVLDGQHRLEACKRLNEPVYWVRLDKDVNTGEALIGLNSNQKTWTLGDYVHYYAKEGNKEYHKILELVELGFNMSNAIAIASQTQSAGKSIKNGSFKCGPVDHITMAGIIDDYQSILTEVVNTKVIRALNAMIRSGNYHHDTHFPRIKMHRYSLEKCASPNQYIAMFEEKINKNQRKEKRVSFK
jgi:hypothetical protein